ncbi:hypothetical protein ADEAN_000864000 [Angomonas deanei]|uniref:HMG box domain-containing protein n=1 Tax=Angomonas deanei TaxID=59799 RepID=A0A7G2CP26_9TRYP|nr:hypothetical protein ADEAN_000864000 [Angomonas deanei]
MQCSCGKKVRYCPCCGEPLEPTFAVGRKVTSAEDKPASSSLPLWAEKLPREELSGFQIFVHLNGNDSSPQDKQYFACRWLQTPIAERETYEEKARLWEKLRRKEKCHPAPFPHVSAVTEKEDRNATLPPPASTDTEPSVPPSHRKDKAAKRRRPSNSFDLFRQQTKGQFSCVSECGAAWRKMSAEEKAPFDQQAAFMRTESYKQKN